MAELEAARSASTTTEQTATAVAAAAERSRAEQNRVGPLSAWLSQGAALAGWAAVRCWLAAELSLSFRSVHCSSCIKSGEGLGVL